MRIYNCRIEGGSEHEAGRRLLAQAYYEQTGEAMPAIATMPRGKPYFPDRPYHFSITHTAHHAFCVLSDCPVGIDAEEMDRRVRLEIARKVLSPGEYARFAAAPDPKAALLRLWVLKEAAVKLTGDGLRGYPNHTDFDPADPRVQEIDGCYVAVLTEDDYAL